MNYLEDVSPPKDIKFHQEPGEINHENTRLVYHYILSRVFNFVPSILARTPNSGVEDGFSVKDIEGERLDEFIATTDIENLYPILLDVVTQMYLLAQYAIVIQDRNPGNIIIDTDGKVWQVDLGYIKDYMTHPESTSASHKPNRNTPQLASRTNIDSALIKKALTTTKHEVNSLIISLDIRAEKSNPKLHDQLQTFRRNNLEGPLPKLELEALFKLFTTKCAENSDQEIPEVNIDEYGQKFIK